MPLTLLGKKIFMLLEALTSVFTHFHFSFNIKYRKCFLHLGFIHLTIQFIESDVFEII